MEDLESIPFYDSERTVMIGSLISKERKEKWVSFLRANHDVFTWSPADMPDIDPEVITHRLNVNSSYKQVKQKG